MRLKAPRWTWYRLDSSPDDKLEYVITIRRWHPGFWLMVLRRVRINIAVTVTLV